MVTSFQRSCLAALIAVAGFSVSGACAAEVQPLIEGQGVAVTTQDVLGDALRIPTEVRNEVLGKPTMLAQLASNLYVFRTLAKQAQEQALDKQPDVVAAMRIAQERVLAEAWLNQLDEKNRPSEKIAEQKAEVIYKADEKKRFMLPEQVRVRHILIAGNDDAARAKAREVLNAVNSGADFAELASKESADKISAARGGDLGFLALESMVSPLGEAAFSMSKPGELSGPVETKFGQHILRLEERRPAGKVPFAEVRASLIAEVQRDAIQAARLAESSKIRQYGTLNEAAVYELATTRESAEKAAIHN